MTRFNRAKAAVAAYTENPDVLTLRCIEDINHPAAPIAVTYSADIVAGEPVAGYLVHYPYSVRNVEELTFTAWPPRSVV